MGLFGGNKKKDPPAPPLPAPEQPSKPALDSPATNPAKDDAATAAVREQTSVFEFGSAAGGGVTLAGYCPISDEMEPCRWEILPSGGNEAPKFRIIF